MHTTKECLLRNHRRSRVTRARTLTALGAAALCSTLSLGPESPVEAQPRPFELVDATIEDVQAEFKAGRLTSRALVQAYLDRIEAYDKNGPKLNTVITINPKALDEAAALDAAYKRSGPVGPLHGIQIGRASCRER